MLNSNMKELSQKLKKVMVQNVFFIKNKATAPLVDKVENVKIPKVAFLNCIKNSFKSWKSRTNSKIG